MRLLSSIAYHLDRYKIIGDIGLSYIKWSVVILTVVFLLHRFYKKELYSRNIAIVGGILRVGFLLVLGYEFLHLSTVNEAIGVNDNLEIVSKLWSNLFFGYMIVFGLYYIFTLRNSKYKGYFFGLDILVMSTPVIHKISIIIYGLIALSSEEIMENLNFLLLQVFIIIAVAAISYLFFKIYWKKTFKSISLFYVLTLLCISVSVWINTKMHGYTEDLLVTALFLFLLMSYDLIEYYIHKKDYQDKVVTEVLIYISVAISILVLNPFYSLVDYSVNNTVQTGMMRTVIKDNANLSKPRECEMIARRIVNDYESDFIIDGTSGIGVMYYQMNALLGEYEFSFESTGDVLSSISNSREFERDNKDSLNGAQKHCDEKEIRKKTIELLEKLNNPYEKNREEMVVRESNDGFEVTLVMKMSDMSICNSDKFARYIIQRNVKWTKDGTIISYSKGRGAQFLQCYSNINLDRDEIDNIVREFQELLTNNKSAYIISNIRDNYEKAAVIEIETEDESIKFDAETKELVSFSINKDPQKGSYSLKKASLDDKKYVDEFLKKIGKQLNEYKLKLVNKSFEYYNDKEHISVSLNNENKVARYLRYELGVKGIGNINKYSDLELTPNQAIKTVKKMYSPFEVYKSRVSIGFFEEDNEVKSGYIVEIFPFRKAERHVYRVDNTGKAISYYDFSEVNSYE